ncbi:MAG: hypothetical protein K6E35_07425 [Bacteroidales bacterium]|nr:hypothetical protein [Bacteroidales bacterium]
MIGYLIGDLAGGPYDAHNVFTPDKVEFFVPHRFIFGRMSYEGQRYPEYSEDVKEVAASKAFLVSAAMARFMFDTKSYPNDRLDGDRLRASLEVFADDYGMDFPFSPRFMPAAVMVMSSFADNEKQLSGMIDALVRAVNWDGLNEPRDILSAEDQKALRSYGSALFAIRSGSLSEVESVLDENVRDSLLLPASAFIETGSSIEVKGENGVYEKPFLLEDMYIGSEKPNVKINKDLNRSILVGLKAAFESSSFEGALRSAIAMGGDSSVSAAVAASLAEVRFRGQEKSFDKMDCLARTFMPSCFSKVLDRYEERRGAFLRFLRKGVVGEDEEFVKEHLSRNLMDGDGRKLVFNQSFGVEVRKEFAVPYFPVQVLRKKECGTGAERVYFVPEWNSSTLVDLARRFSVDYEVKADGGIEMREASLKSLRNFYEKSVSQLKARFGDSNVVIGGDPKAAYDAEYASWNIEGETYYAGKAPELMTRFLVENYPTRVRDESGKLVYREQDQCLPLWRLGDMVYLDGKVARGLEMRMKEEFGTREHALSVYKALRPVYNLRRKKFVDAMNQSKAEGFYSGKEINSQEEKEQKKRAKGRLFYLSKELGETTVEYNRCVLALAVLGREKGQFESHVRELFMKYGSSEAPLKEAKDLLARIDEMDPGAERDALENKRGELLRDGLVLAEVESCRKSVYRKAMESYQVLSGLNRHAIDVYESVFDKRSEIFLDIHFGGAGSDGDENENAYSLECGTDHFSVRHGDFTVGSLEVSPVTGALVHNRLVTPGVTQSRGKLSAVPMQNDYSVVFRYSSDGDVHYRQMWAGLEGKIDDYCNQVDAVVLDAKMVDELRDEREQVKNTRSGPYGYEMSDNVSRLLDSFGRGESLDLNDITHKPRARRF